MKKLYLILLLSFIHGNIVHAYRSSSVTHNDQKESQWLSQHATPEQKSLIVHMRVTLRDKKAFTLTGYDLETFNTFPEDIKEYLTSTFANICGVGVRDCDSLLLYYQKSVGFHRYLFQPTDEELENFNNEEYWQNRMEE